MKENQKWLAGLAIALSIAMTTNTMAVNAEESVTVDTHAAQEIALPKKEYLKREILEQFTEDVAAIYDLPPELLQAIAERESSLNIYAENGTCQGLMQVSVRWHYDRMEKLKVKSLYDPYGNILVAADYLHELMEDYKDLPLALMIYNGSAKAKEMHAKGEMTDYASDVISRMTELQMRNQNNINQNYQNTEEPYQVWSFFG